jgi:L-rhamnose mutarotase
LERRLSPDLALAALRALLAALAPTTFIAGDDLAADLARMAQDPVTQAWWRLTDPCQEPLPSAAPGERWVQAEEVFHVD